MGWFRRSRPAQPAEVGPEPATAAGPLTVEPPLPTFIEDAGASMTTVNVVDGIGRVRFMVRDPAVDSRPADNGWRVFSELDTDEYIAVDANLLFVDFNQLCAIEPALIGIWDLPVGTELEIVRDETGIHLLDAATGEELPDEVLFVPEQHRA